MDHATLQLQRHCSELKSDNSNDVQLACLAAENVNRKIKNDNMDSHTHFMEQAFNKPYPSMECKCTTTNEVGQNIKSLKKTHTGTTRYLQRF
jgi:hypothetical protein